MLVNNEEIFVMLLQEGLVDLYKLVGGCHVMACPLWDLGANYEENIFLGDPCSWALCDSTSRLLSPSKELSEPVAVPKQASSVLTQ